METAQPITPKRIINGDIRQFRVLVQSERKIKEDFRKLASLSDATHRATVCDLKERLVLRKAEDTD